MKYVYLVHWTMRAHKGTWWDSMSANEQQKEWAKKLKEQEKALEKHGFKLAFWGPAWGADHDYISVIKSDKAPEHFGALMTDWNAGWVKTKTIIVTPM